MENTLKVTLGNNAQHMVFIRELTANTLNIPRNSFIKLTNTENKKTLISRIQYSNDICLPLDSILLNSRTQAQTLYVSNKQPVKYEILTPDKIPKTHDVTFFVYKSKKKVRYPQFTHELYLEPGYVVMSHFGYGKITKGKGLYRYDSSTVLDTLCSDSQDDSDIIIVPENTGININFCQMGIGGLTSQMNTLIKQVLISRIINLEMRQKYQVKDIRGILLFGPPGTGKTKIAKNISNIIPNSVIKKVNGPELSSKFYGESEQNVRNLFQDAKNNPSKLHIIIFDEIDAVGRRRGEQSSNHDDKVLTQLLTMIDGLDSVPNVLIIGITNRKDILDTALIRAGRLECHIEIPLPTYQGRKEIIEIYLQPLIKQDLVEVESIDIDELCKMTDGYSGADIESLIGRVKNLALLRNCDVSDNMIKTKNNINVLSKITLSDFNVANNEFQPTFSKQNDTVQRYIHNYPIDNEKYNELLKIKKSTEQNLNNIMIKPHIIKRKATEFDRVDVCHLAIMLDLPYINYLSYNRFLGKHTSQNCYILEDAYMNCLQAERAILILDSLDDVNDRDLILRQKYISENPIDKNKKLIIIILSNH